MPKGTNCYNCGGRMEPTPKLQLSTHWFLTHGRGREHVFCSPRCIHQHLYKLAGDTRHLKETP